MIFRGRAPEATVWRRFRSGMDGFTFTLTPDGIYEAQIVANGERTVDLFYTWCEQLPPAVDVVMSDRRSKRTWRGEDVALPDLRDAVARLKVPLATYGGVEITAYTPDDQLTLTASLELYIYARSDRWLYLLQGRGLEEYKAAPRLWQRRQPWAPADVPVLREALDATAQRLSLRAEPFTTHTTSTTPHAS